MIRVCDVFARDSGTGVCLESGRHKIGGWRYSDALQKDQCRTDRSRR
jgi:hypothetical protein